MQENTRIIDDMFNNLSVQHQKKPSDEFKIREFEWYDLETKIRTFVYKLIEPHLKSNIEQKSNNDKLALKLEKHIEHYNEFRNLCLNQGNEIPIIQTMMNNIEKLNKETSLLGSQFEFTAKQSQTVSEQTVFKFQTQELQLQGLYDFKASMLEEMSALVKTNANFKNDLAKMLENLCNEQVKQQSEFSKEFSKFSNLFDEQMHANNESSIKQQSLEKKCDFLNSQLGSQLQQIVKSQQDIAGLQDFQAMLRTIQDEQQRISHQYAATTQKMQSLENYLEKYQPLYIQGLISDTLHSCLPDAQKNQLALFEEKKFTEMHQIILNDNGVSKLQEKMEEFSAFVEHIVKRNKNIVKEEKSKEIINKKSERQSSHQSEQDSDDASSASEKSEAVASNEFQKFRNRKGQASVEQVDFLKLEMKNYVDAQYQSFSSQFSEKMSKMKEQITYLDESLHLNVANMINQIEQASQSFSRQLEEQIQRAIYTQDQLNPIFVSLQSLREQSNLNAHGLKSLHQYCILSQHLALQDEIDRQGLALFGVREQLKSAGSAEQEKKGSVQIDQKCLSCSGQSAVLVQAFKLACLSYQPNDVQIDGKNFKRVNLSQNTQLLQEYILESCQQILNQLKSNYASKELDSDDQCKSESKQSRYNVRTHSPLAKYRTQISDPMIDEQFKQRVKSNILEYCKFKAESTSAYTYSRQRRHLGSQERKDKEKMYLIVRQQTTVSGSKGSDNSTLNWQGLQPTLNKKLLYYGKKKTIT